VFLSIVVGCEKTTIDRNSTIEFSKTQNWSVLDTLKFEDNILMNPGTFLIFDSILVVQDTYGEFNISVINMKSNELVARLAKTGRGPKEVVQFGGLVKGSSPREFCILDIKNNSVLFYNLDSINIKKNEWIKRKNLKLENGQRIYAFGFISDSIIVGTGINQNGRYLVYDFVNETFVEGIDYPNSEKERDINYVFKGYAYQGYLCSNTRNKKFVSATIHGNLLEIGQYKKDKLSSLQNLGSYRTKYTIMNGEYRFEPGRKAGFSSLTSGDKYIYALFSGRTFEEYEMEVRLCNTIFMLDWDGNSVKKITTKEKIKSITVDDNEKMLYAIIHAPNPMIVRYQL
jgi:hypothetical protein